jgi:LysR family glycine cleavage system transcriptional activator
MRRLPPLNALRAFEAAARHASFRAAAAELGVTPAAVSHQIKGLEEQLKLALFQRGIRQVRLTRAGQALQPGLTAGFDRLAEAVERTLRPATPRTITVTGAPSIAARWLVPRIERFQARHPELEVRISATTALVDFSRGDVDVGLRYGAGRYPGLYTELLFTNEVFPVCAPALAKGPPALREPDDLRHVTLIHEKTPYDDPGVPDWTMWLAAAGATKVDTSGGMQLDRPGDVTDAALAGAGVALGKSALVLDALAAGKLVRPFALTMRGTFAYYFVCPQAAIARPEIQDFRAWLLEEVRATGERAKPARKVLKPRPPRSRARASRRS